MNSLPVADGQRRRDPDRMADLVEEYWDLALIEDLYRGCVRVSPADFGDVLHQRFGRRGRLLLTGSARQALRLVFSSAASRSSRRRVLLSSFNCRVVADAVASAGLSIDTFDLAAPDGRIDWERVGRDLRDEHLAVIVPHFFGIPADFAAMMPAARSKGVLIIEDCAHTLGGRVAGVTAGQIGDAAVFSFNYDKPISLAGGGALLINNPSIGVDGAADVRAPSKQAELRQFRQLAATLRRARRRNLRRSLIERVGAKLRIGPFATPGLPPGIGPLRAAAGIWQLERYDEIRRMRDRHARMLLQTLRPLSWHAADSVEPAFLKLRVILPDADADASAGARGAIAACREAGITVANSNWPRLVEAGSNRTDRINASSAAAHGLDVPVHQNLSDQDIETIKRAFCRCAPARS